HGGGVLAFLEQLVDGEPELARHGRDRLADAAAVEGEERVDEVVRPERGLAHHLPHQRRLPKPTGSIEWVRHCPSSFAPRRGRRWKLGGGLRPPSEPPPRNRLRRQSRRSNRDVFPPPGLCPTRA